MALHAVKAGQRIHNGVVKPMPHVQAASDVGRRDHDAKRGASARRLKVAFVFPFGVAIGLNGGWIVGGGECAVGSCWRGVVSRHGENKWSKKLPVV